MLFNNRLKIYRTLIFSIIFLVTLSIIELFIEKKVHFEVERIPNFYGFLGFFSALIIILIALLLKKTGLSKKEDYYD